MLNKFKNKALDYYYHLSYKRKSRLYCVGAAKTGTHSIDSMFNGSVRTSHEAESEELIGKIFEIENGRAKKQSVVSYIKSRDKRLCLDVDSSQLNYFLLDYLLDEFPDALFLLTIRDCYTWLDSFINDSLCRKTTKNWIQLRDYRFQSNVFAHTQEEYVLKEKGLYTLDGYLSYWANHNNKVLSTVPKDRLMVVRTNEISQKAPEIASFAGLPKGAIQIESSHSFKNPKKYHLLREIRESYLEKKVEEFCDPLMKKFFPEIQSIDDAGI